MPVKILILDNYDSFTYNLVHLIGALGYKTDVYRNDKISIESIEPYDKILLSPGPGIPSEAGIMLDLISKYSPQKSILGVCLGHQGIAEIFGAMLLNLEKVLHGVETETEVLDKNEPLFRGIPEKFEAGHYHSWSVDPRSIPDCLKVTAKDSLGNIMAISHKKYDVRGVQFHPESVMTEYGQEIVKNWIEI